MEQLTLALRNFPRRPNGPDDDVAFDKSLKEYSKMLLQLPSSTTQAILKDPVQAIKVGAVSPASNAAI